MRIIAYRTSSIGKDVLIQESTEEAVSSRDLDRLFGFMVEPFKDTLRVCWNLDTTVSVLLRLLTKEQCDTLRSTKKLYIAPYSLFYVREKVFIVKHIPSGNKCHLYNLQQYFPELPEPEDIQEVQMLGEKLLYELGKMGMKPTKLTSPVAIYDECIMSKLDLPQLKDMPKEAAELAFKCSARLWIEAHQLGYWEQAYDYDMTSAFPSVMQSLRDIRYCDWVQDDRKPKKAVYGYTECDVTIYDWVVVHPILFETEDRLFSPVGEWMPTEQDKNKLDFIDTWKIGEYRIKDGWWAIPKNGIRELPKPLYEPLAKLLRYKQGTALQSLLAKRMSTGIYGKLGEEWDKEFGEHFCPVWFNEVSSQCTIMLASWLYGNGIGAGDNAGYRSLIQIGVDGCLLDKPIEEINK